VLSTGTWWYLYQNSQTLTHAASAPLGHPLQKRTVVQWDMGAVLGRDGGTDESMFPQFGIRLRTPSDAAKVIDQLKISAT
jgi:hypothetical protein